MSYGGFVNNNLGGNWGGGYGGGGGFGGGGGGGGGYGGRGGGRGRRDGGGGRGRGRGGGGHGGGDQRPPPPENTNARLRKMVVKFADEEDFHPTEDPPRLAKVLRRQWKEGSHGVLDGFRIGVTQEPHKHAHFISLLRAVSFMPAPTPAPAAEVKTEDASMEADAGVGAGAETDQKPELVHDPEEPNPGKDILEDLARAFRSWVDGREWLNMRLTLQFFSSLVPAGLVTPASLLELYQSLLAVLQELGGGGDRAERVVRTVGEGLIRSGAVLNELYPDELSNMIDMIETSINNRRAGKAVKTPYASILPEGEEPETYLDTSDELLAALRGLQADGFVVPPCIPSYSSGIEAPEGFVEPQAFELSSVSMPPELYDVDEDRWQTGEGQTGSIKLFADEVVASTSTAHGWALRSLVLDVVHIFEVNRKESARILLSLPRFIASGTFKSSEPDNTSTLSLETLLISTLLNALFLLPAAPCKEMYYGSVITELCKTSPNTVAPPVGRAVRKLYGLLGEDALDVEVARRLGEWFAVHLSNFGFQWMWKEWVPDLQLPAAHPKKAFMRRIIDLEIRLAYHDRILETLPEPMASELDGIISKDPPEPIWAYENEDHPLNAEATRLLKMYRAKASAQDVRVHLSTLPDAFSGPDEPMSAEVRLMAVQTLLQLGARSFSHFLNATERYLDVLRFLTPDPASRQVVLRGVYEFWRASPHMRLIVLDKYVQYGVLEGLDVVDWVFAPAEGLGGANDADGWTDGWRWEVLRMCLDKHVGRVAAVKNRVKLVEKEDEGARARRAAERLERGEGVGEETIDADGDADDIRQERSRAAQDAQGSLDIHTTRLEKVLLTTIKHFVRSLLPWTEVGAAAASGGAQSDDGLKAVLALLEAGEEGFYPVRARWGWFREFVRLYALHLIQLDEVVERDVLGPLGAADAPGGEVEGRAARMVRGVWAAGVRGDE